jgi:hypothetical protein
MHSVENLYNARLGKVRWFIKRFGAGELVRKPLRLLLAPLWIRLLPKAQFQFQGEALEYFYHRYNMTWATERCVEVPVARWYLHRSDPRDVLEVGNVLSHYGPVQHEVLDKFEKGPGIMNSDIVEYRAARKYALILSISTFEHIGFDDAPAENSRAKILAAVQACRNLLQPNGLLVVTIPVGYNPDLDALLGAGAWAAAREFYFQRRSARAWSEASRAEALGCRYGKPYPYANGIVVAEFRSHASRAS